MSKWIVKKKKSVNNVFEFNFIKTFNLLNILYLVQIVRDYPQIKTKIATTLTCENTL